MNAPLSPTDNFCPFYFDELSNFALKLPTKTSGGDI